MNGSMPNRENKYIAWAVFALGLLTLGLTACGSSSSTPTPTPITPSPSVTSTTPADVATNVPLNTKPTAVFNMAMGPLNATTFTLYYGSALVPGSVATSADGMTATFSPSVDMAPSGIYTASINTGAMSMSGKAMMTNHMWSFTTTATVAAPLVSSTNPAAGATGVALNTKVAATFSKAMNPLSISTSTFTMKQGNTSIAGTVSYGPGTAATFTPTNPLTGNAVYTATLSTGAMDMMGSGLATPCVWSFTTGTAVDTTAPTVGSTTPTANATGVTVNTTVAATFSKPMDPTTLTPTTFTVKQGITPVSGTVVYGPGTTVTFTPAGPLVGATLYTANLGTAVKDLQGNALATAFAWSFTTGAMVPKGPAIVNLGTSGNYVILAKTGISTVPASVITGDIAVSPAAASYLTGFSLSADSTNVFSTSPQITGQAFAANYAVPTPSNLTTAVSDMETAYTDAAGRVTPDFLELGTGNLGGKTLMPGLYKWTSSVTMPSDVVISGGANDIWIFQTSGDLTMSASVKITLAGGAQAKHIFWQVAGQGTLGTGAHFEGILLCKTQVTLQTGASMNGRLLAQTQVALQQATVTKP